MNATSVPYNLLNITSTNNILEFVQNINDMTGESLMTGMLFAGWIILFVSMKSGGNKDALMASSFIIAIMSVFFRALDFISNAKVITIMIVFVAIFVITMWKKD